MRKRLLFIFTLLSFYQVYAQSFIPASIVLLNGDSLSGCIRPDYSNDNFYFRRDCMAKAIRYSAATVKQLRVGSLIYDRNEVDDKMIFIQKVVGGSATLYTLEHKPLGKTRYFLKTGNAFEELVYTKEEVVNNGQRYQQTDPKFLKTFARLLSDCNEFTNSKWEAAFTTKTLAKMVDAYNRCKQQDGSGIQSVVYPVSAKIPAKFFIRLGINSALVPSPVVRETKELYTRHIIGDSRVFGTPTYAFEDQGSRTSTNLGWTATAGLEQKILGGRYAWGGQLSYSSSYYKRQLLTGGTTDAYTDQYNYMTPQNYELSIPSQQPVRFEGIVKEQTSIAELSIFARKYLFTNQSIWYLGIGLGYGLVQSDYTSSIKLSTTDKTAPVYLGEIVRYAQPHTIRRGQLGGFGEVGWQKSPKFGVVAQFNWLYTGLLNLQVNHYF